MYVSQVLSVQNLARSNQTKIFLNLRVRIAGRALLHLSTLASLRRSCIWYWNCKRLPSCCRASNSIAASVRLCESKACDSSIWYTTFFLHTFAKVWLRFFTSPLTLRGNFKIANAVLKRIRYLLNGARAKDRAAVGSVLPLQVF